jgi:hypothetical protein
MLICLLTVDKYDFIYEMDLTIPRGSLIDNSGSGNAVAGLVLFVLFIAQLIFLCFEKSTKWKWAAVAMTASACLYFFVRQGPSNEHLTASFEGLGAAASVVLSGR